MKNRGGGDGDDGTQEMTVYDYFVNVRKIDLRYSAELPCINVGRPKRPTYFPIEVNEGFFFLVPVLHFLTVIGYKLILITYLVINHPFVSVGSFSFVNWYPCNDIQKLCPHFKGLH